MAIKVGFVLLTHNQPWQAMRLVRTLNSMFDEPPIAWHHDFRYSALPFELPTKNIRLVQPQVKTGWGKFGTVEAMLKALELLFEMQNPPDWFVLLSGSDYPIKSADQIASDLSASQFDAHISHEQICFNKYESDFQRECYERYCTVMFRATIVNRKLRRGTRVIRLRHPVFTALFTPFSRDFRCYAGQHWFCANRAAANYLIEFHNSKQKLAKHYKSRDIYTIIPEESYYQTILCNSHLKISPNDWRYIDWSNGGPHPKILGKEDLPKLLDSTAHFARKFDIDVEERILDTLDELILN